MKKRAVRELALFGGLFIVLAPVWHPDLLTAPAARLEALLSGQAALLHPLLWTAGVYFLLLFFRLVFAVLRKILFRIKSRRV